MTSLRPQAVVMGASVGAVDALSAILTRLPARFPLPVMIVVHLPSDQKSLLVDLFAAKCRMKVREPDDKEPILPGVIYLAPPDYHLLVEHERIFSLANDDPVNFCRPAIDPLFESAAEVYTNSLIGVILTGANHDGTAGLRRIGEAGGTTFVQRPNTAASPIMPVAAQKAWPDARVFDLEQIADFLMEFTETR